MKKILRLIAILAAVVTTGGILSAAGAATAATPDRAVTTRTTKTVQAGTVTPEDVSAQSCRVPRCFGAMSMSPDQAYGYYINTSTSRSATRKAHSRCKWHSNYPGSCRRMGWVRNGCMAVAIKTNADGWVTHWATGYGRSKRAAMRQAKNRNNGGHIRAYLCTSRRY